MNLDLPIKVVCSGERVHAYPATFAKFWSATSLSPQAITAGDTLNLDYTFRLSIDGDPKLALQSVAEMLTRLGPEGVKVDMRELRRIRQSIRDIAAALDRIEDVHDRF